MRLLQQSITGEFSLTKKFAADDEIPPYAILSHTWRTHTKEEVTFEDMLNGTGTNKPGYKKIQFCGEQARKDELQHFWIDTCCIDKTNYSELSQSINSMFRWYRNATRCYVYLSDVSIPSVPDNESNQQWEPDFRKCKWFTRGWTLQELLAPSSVEFFSQDWQKLGDKITLIGQIHTITGIPNSALQGGLLSQFTDNERFLWMERRQTTVAEDKVYALLGIFDVNIPLSYGEGANSAFKRLQKEIEKLKQCIQDLRLTDPRNDKKRIEEIKGGLLEGSYNWILENSDFQQWRNDRQSQLLWIKGDPGKGKTMLLCGIINELEKSNMNILSYFFCQATDSRINSATSVLRGLLYLLVNRRPSLVSHIRKKHDYAGKTLFDDANAWVALSEIFIDMVQDPGLHDIYLIVDALDECVIGLPKLLDFIVQISSMSSHVKWIVSSRNWPTIEERLERAGHKVRLSLELNAESVSTAVRFYIRHRVSQLAQEKNYTEETKNAVLSHLYSNADNTFLWVALVCQNLGNIPRWKILAKLKAFPPGLDSLYKRMIQHIENSEDADLCWHILALIAIVYRPITLEELTLVEGLNDMADDLESLREIIGLCGSLLTIREGTIYFLHQSAKDFLLKEIFNTLFPSGREEAHYAIFSRSLQVMSKTLRRDMYNLGALGYPAKQVVQPDPDPLVASRYSCIYWVDHLYDSGVNSVSHSIDLQDRCDVGEFLRTKYLYWLEALSLCKSMSKGVASIAKLEIFIQGKADTSNLIDLIRDARRFIMAHKLAIENSPLQAYASALVFSPKHSLIRNLFKKEEPKWITIIPATEDKWSACLQTLEGHTARVRSAAFSHDSTQLASASEDKSIKIWDTSSGECLQTLKGHSKPVFSVTFSHESSRLASASEDKTVKIWDRSSGECLNTLKGHSDRIWLAAFSHDSRWLASASGDRTVKIWDAYSGKCLQTLKGHSDWVRSVTFSHDSKRIISSSADNTAKIWDVSSGDCLRTFSDHGHSVWSAAFSHDSTRLALALEDMTIKVWDASSGECLQILEGHTHQVRWVNFSHDSTRVASGSEDKTVKIWDASTGKCLQTFKGHGHRVHSVAFSHDSTRLASSSEDKTVRIWDTRSGDCVQTLDSHGHSVLSVSFSHNLTWLASASGDKTVKIWDASSGKCLQTLKGHSHWVWLAVFSHDSERVASASEDKTVKIWDSSNGECLQTLKGHSDRVWSVAFSHDSTRLASVSGDKEVKIWDASSGECLQSLKSHGSVGTVAFSHDSTRLAAASADTIMIWGASSGELLQTFDGHDLPIYSLAFSHDSTRLASGSEDTTIKIWEASSGRCLQTLETGYSDLFNVSFDVTGSYLHTSIGNIAIDASCALDMALGVTDPQSLRYQETGLSTDNEWITYNSENLLWLPSEYRPCCSVVSGKTISIGVGSGKVWICRFYMNDS